eukprot:NODE_12107_length_267_cov_1.004717.p2 GENE.NODE_12107_length_267_cov_1.004717~~NODE_12107_length_267_cov_1.004717.p2  ORF type:complete len:57 (-),score=9.41 NODE_12107_length_267_cov_1.004717:95-265(-)
MMMMMITMMATVIITVLSQCKHAVFDESRKPASHLRKRRATSLPWQALAISGRPMS